jgi:hypothetical protein
VSEDTTNSSCQLTGQKINNYLIWPVFPFPLFEVNESVNTSISFLDVNSTHFLYNYKCFKTLLLIATPLYIIEKAMLYLDHKFRKVKGKKNVSKPFWGANK